MHGNKLEVGLASLGDLLSHPHTGHLATERQRHRSLIDQAVLAEGLGFTSVHLGEHHFSDYMLSCPPVVLAAIGERTERVTLSTSVTLAGNLDPVRMAEDYATLDVLSGGRAELVLGRGHLFVRTYEGFGHPVETARERYDENVALLCRLLREENVTWEGRFRSPLNGHTTRPRPLDDLPVWIGAGSRESASLAAELGCHLMLPSVFGRPEIFRGTVAAYRQRWEELGKDWADARVGAISHTHVAKTTQEARKRFEPFYTTTGPSWAASSTASETGRRSTMTCFLAARPSAEARRRSCIGSASGRSCWASIAICSCSTSAAWTRQPSTPRSSCSAPKCFRT